MLLKTAISFKLDSGICALSDGHMIGVVTCGLSDGHMIGVVTCGLSD